MVPISFSYFFFYSLSLWYQNLHQQQKVYRRGPGASVEVDYHSELFALPSSRKKHRKNDSWDEANAVSPIENQVHNRHKKRVAGTSAPTTRKLFSLRCEHFQLAPEEITVLLEHFREAVVDDVHDGGVVMAALLGDGLIQIAVLEVVAILEDIGMLLHGVDLGSQVPVGQTSLVILKVRRNRS